MHGMIFIVIDAYYSFTACDDDEAHSLRLSPAPTVHKLHIAFFFVFWRRI